MTAAAWPTPRDFFTPSENARRKLHQLDGANAWTWQACGDELTDTRWARVYASTVTDP